MTYLTTFNHIDEMLLAKGIVLKPFDSHSSFRFKGGATNQYKQVESVSGQAYLIRFNGKLWAPFTRQAEDYHLTRLADKGVNTHVITNNVGADVQLCRAYPLYKTFSEAKSGARKQGLVKIANKMALIHGFGFAEQSFDLSSNILHNVSNIKGSNRMLTLMSQLVLKVVTQLAADSENQVFSHNDLLPNSVYMHEDDVAIVDWEYAGVNHRTYDLALFSLKAKLTANEENCMLQAYDKDQSHDLSYSMLLVKLTIHFMALMWQAKTWSKAGVQSSPVWLQVKNAALNLLNKNSLRVSVHTTSLVNRVNLGMFSRALMAPFNLESKEQAPCVTVVA